MVYSVKNLCLSQAKSFIPSNLAHPQMTKFLRWIASAQTTEYLECIAHPFRASLKSSEEEGQHRLWQLEVGEDLRQDGGKCGPVDRGRYFFKNVKLCLSRYIRILKYINSVLGTMYKCVNSDLSEKFLSLFLLLFIF